jgi:signal transduction histidine kinase
MTRPARPIGDAALVRRVRWRLLAWSGGTTLIAMVALGSLLYAAVALSLATSGEQQLRVRAMDIAQGVEARGVIGFGGQPAVGVEGGPDSPPVLVERAELPGLVIGGPTSGTIGFITSVEGGIVEAGGIPPTLEPLLSLRAVVTQAITSGQEAVATVEVRGTSVRMFVLPVTVGDNQLIIQVVGDRTAEVNTLRVLLLVLAIGGLAVLAASLVVGWVYAERALVPIRDALRRQREFAADASHELRTPLAVVRGSVEDLRRNADRPVATVGNALDDIESEVDRLTALVDDLLLLARTDSGVIELASEPTDLAEIALDASGALVAEANRRGVRIEVDAQPVPLVADPAHLRQLVTILLDNAVRHAPTGSTIEVGVTAIDGSARLRVDDRGGGFRPEDLPRAFDRFWRAPDAPPGGTGLGLSIAAWIAQRHGGSITAANRPDGGARLEVLLPLR